MDNQSCSMARLMAIDYGRRRCGIAVTDTLQLVANSLTTVDTRNLQKFLTDYVTHEEVEAIVVGHPTDMHGADSESMRYIRPALGQLRKAMPQVPFILYDERFTSVLAHRAMLDGGVRKMARRDKAAVDAISAAIILNDYLNSRQYIK